MLNNNLDTSKLTDDSVNKKSLSVVRPKPSKTSFSEKSDKVLGELKSHAENKVFLNPDDKTIINPQTGKIMPPPNYDNMMHDTIKKILMTNKKPTLLLHSCCAPCSSYVLKLLQKYFNIMVYFYNSNLFPLEEYNVRLENQKKLIRILNKEARLKTKSNQTLHQVFYETPIRFKCGEYVKEDYYSVIKGYEKEFEGGNRCYLCYLMRINKAGELAAKQKFDYFTTTLTVSPYKNSFWVNKIGKMVSEKWEVAYLFSDFKKNDGYKKSIEYSKEYGLYRQEYCGCEFSLLAKKNCLA